MYTVYLRNNGEKIIHEYDFKRCNYRDRLDNSMSLALVDAIKKGVDLSDLYLPGGDFYAVDFSDVNLRNADLGNCAFYACHFDRANLSNATIYGLKLHEGCTTTGWKLPERYTPPEGAFKCWKVVSSVAYPNDKYYNNYYLLELAVPAEARRVVAASSIIDRMRVEYATPIGLYYLSGNAVEEEYMPLDIHPPQWRSRESYVIGQVYTPTGFDDDMFEECGQGINAFLHQFQAQEYARRTFNIPQEFFRAL